LVRFPQGILGTLDISDVDRAADEAEQLATIADAGNGGDPEPAILSVGTAEPELHLEALALLVGALVGGQESRCIGGMEEVLPTGPFEPIEAAAGKPEPLTVHELVAIGSGEPDQHRDIVGQVTEAIFALPHQLLGMLAVRDIDQDIDRAD